MVNFKQHADKYFYLFADCFIVHGYTRSMILDTSNKKYVFIDNDYANLLGELRDVKIGVILGRLADEESRLEFNAFLNFLYENEKGEIVDDINLFPQIKQEWDVPAVIVNSIIDLGTEMHEFGSLFQQLDDLGCRYIQLRSFERQPLSTFEAILESARNHDFFSIEILTKYDEYETDINRLLDFCKKYMLVNFVIHSVENKDQIFLDENNLYSSHLLFLEQRICSCDACGVINKESFIVPSIDLLMENILYNSCLNRKISIDSQGAIKNCPSMLYDFGNIKTTSLAEVVDNLEFKGYWHIKKDSIGVCKDCEYRYICTDCRAYIVNNENIYSKPLKCKYDPYQGVWLDQNSYENN